MKKYKDGIFTLIFWGALVCAFGYLFYTNIWTADWSGNYLYKAVITIIVYIVIINIPREEGKDFEESVGQRVLRWNNIIKIDGIILYLVLLFSFPALLIGLGIMLFTVNNLFYIIAIYFVVTFVLFITQSKNKLVNLFAGITLCLLLYFGFNARNDFKVEFRATFQDEVIFGN